MESRKTVNKFLIQKFNLNSRGQVLIETMLLTVVLIGVFFAISQSLKESRVVQKIVSEPWDKVSGLAESGVYSDPQRGGKHPNSYERFMTPEN